MNEPALTDGAFGGMDVVLFAVPAPNFDEFSACSNAEAILGGVVRVSVLVAPFRILLIVQMANDRPGQHTDGYAGD